MKNPEEIDPDWARYAETILSFAGDRPFELDLRENLTAEAHLEFQRRGFPRTFAVLTAHDPEGQDLTADENKLLQQRLEGELTDSGIHFLRVNACSMDRKHCECSVALDVDQERAVEIAAQHEQMAIFWYDGDAFWLIGVIVKSDPIRLPRSA